MKKLDPVTRYATDVVARRIVACRLVTLACERHLADLKVQAAKGLEWRPEEAQRVIDFFSDVLYLPENTDADDGEDDELDLVGEVGQPFILSPFQAFIAGSLFGWYRVRGTKARRRFRVAYVETAKGSGKTPFGAGLMLYLLVADGELGAQIYAAAPTLKQAQDTFRDGERMVDASPHLKALVDAKVNNLAVLDTGSFFRPISSEKRGLDGKRVHGAIVDELHEHESYVVTVKIRAGTKGRRNALILEITNSGFDLESVCWHHHDYSRQVLEGTIANESWFAFVCHLDPCDACLAAGKTQPADDCPRCDSWRIEGPHWLKANPNLGVSLSWQYLREQVQIGIDMPSERNMVRRLNFCQWTQQATVWIPTEQWLACLGSLTEAMLAGRECFIGVDLSDKIDLSSVVLVFPRPLSTATTVAGRAPIDHAVDVLTFFWMPEKTLHRRAQEDKVPYPEWRDDKFVFSTPGPIIDHDVIVDFIIALADRFRVRGIGIDQAGAAGAVNRLQRHFGTELVAEIPQGFKRLSEPSKLLEALIVSGHLVHTGNPCMNWNMANMAIEENAWQEIRPVKISQRKRIDGGVALIDALAQMIATHTEPVPDPVLVML